jgi:hypothetical protein
MNEENRIVLNKNDVIRTDHNILVRHTTFTQSDLLDEMRDYIRISDQTEEIYNWIGEGIDCQVLQCQSNAKGWQSGKLRITLEFIPEKFISTSDVNYQPDDSDSSLDEIRQMIN